MKKGIRGFSLVGLACVLLCAALTLGVGAAGGRTQARSTGDYAELQVIPGGIPFGVKFQTDGVLIVGFCDINELQGGRNPAREAGLRLRDIVTHVGGEAIESAEHLARLVTASGGAAIEMRYTRGGKPGAVTLTPVPDGAGGFRTGLYVRDSGAGIGTVTFIIPKSKVFAGLGHGICDTETGELMPLHRGQVTPVTISGVHRGAAGAPGELRGYFGAARDGTLLGNTPCGVYGLYRSIPDGLPTEPCGILPRDEVREGEVTVLCTLSSNERHAYRAAISAIDRDATGSKCFTVRITDEALLEETGGIVQGMSGSPILQDGKLVGAITHVLINNPTVGYGIFAENMLAQMGELAG